MTTTQSFITRWFPSFEPQARFLEQQVKPINDYLSDSWTPLQLVLWTMSTTAALLTIYRFLFDQDEDMLTRAKQMVFRLARRIPYVQREIAKARDDTLRSVYKDMAHSVNGHKFAQALPEKGLSKDELMQRLKEYRLLEKIDYKAGQVSGCVYKLTKADMTELYNTAFDLFGETNPLHADVFPDIRTMEAEVVRCVATMFHGDENVCGTMTSGGTESLLMACKTCRDLAYSKGIKRPEM